MVGLCSVMFDPPQQRTGLYFLQFWNVRNLKCEQRVLLLSLAKLFYYYFLIKLLKNLIKNLKKTKL